MGPKRARKISISSSSESTSDNQEEDVLDESKFISLEAQQDYYRSVAKSFVTERGLLLEKQDGKLWYMIREREWVGLTTSPMPIPIGIVREFYANADEMITRGITLVREEQVNF